MNEKMFQFSPKLIEEAIRKFENLRNPNKPKDLCEFTLKGTGTVINGTVQDDFELFSIDIEHIKRGINFQ